MMHPRNFDTTKFVNKTLRKKQIHLEKINWNASGLQEKKLPQGENDAEPYGVIVSFDDAWTERKISWGRNLKESSTLIQTSVMSTKLLV